MSYLVNLSDEDLVANYISSQKNIFFEELYDRYADKVFRKCLSFVKDHSTAEDYTHDIFMKLITKLGSFKANAKFSTWLYTITYNFCMDSIRKSKRIREESLDEYHGIEEEENVDELLGMKSEGLRKSLEGVSEQEKAMILMKYQDNFSIKEISEAFDISESATKMRLLRAKEKMKSIYIEHLALLGIIVLKILIFFKK